jgi:hypothetical protein
MRCVFTILCLTALTAHAELQNCIVNGSFGTKHEQHRVRVVSDLSAEWLCGKDHVTPVDIAISGQRLRGLNVESQSEREYFSSGGLFCRTKLPVPDPVPSFAQHAKIMLFFHVGKEADDGNVTLAIQMDGRILFTESIEKSGWQPRAVDLTPWAGKEVTLSIRATSDNGSRAAIGCPRVIDFWGPVQMYPGGIAGTQSGGTGLKHEPRDARAWPDGPALALYQVNCLTESQIKVGFADGFGDERKELAGQELALAPGTHWVPVLFKSQSSGRGILSTAATATWCCSKSRRCPRISPYPSRRSSGQWLVTGGQ